MDPYHGYAIIDIPAKNYLHQLYVDTGCILDDLSGVRDDRDGWRERERERASGKSILSA